MVSTCEFHQRHKNLRLQCALSHKSSECLTVNTAFTSNTEHASATDAESSICDPLITHTHTRMHAHIHAQTQTRTCMHSHAHTHTHALCHCLSVCFSLSPHTHTHTHTHTNTQGGKAGCSSVLNGRFGITCSCKFK